MIRSNNLVAEILNRRFDSEEGLYGKFEDLPLIAQMGHYRRKHLLEELDIGDVSQKVCVDFGTGAWGFACIYPRLQQCGFAYGLDLSQAALQKSEALSQTGKPPYGKRFKYLVSDGMDLPLPDSSVDVVFAGESIEHVRFPKRFLAECYRVLAPGGQLVLTTPNRDAILYRLQDVAYCNSAEHFWLFNLTELIGAVGEFFEVKECFGFNGSIGPGLDDMKMEPESVRTWASLFRDQPEFATGIVLRAVRRPDAIPARYEFSIIDQEQCTIKPAVKRLNLELGLKGIAVDESSPLEFVCPPCDGLVLFFFVHDWSGWASVRCGAVTVGTNLWSKDFGWKPLHLGVSSADPTLVSIVADGRKDPRSQGDEVIFFEALAYRG